MEMRKVKIGDVEIDVVETESAVDHAEITNYAVEDGTNFADHHAIKPSEISITGIFGAEGSDKKLAQLQKYLRTAKLVRYSGRNLYYNMAILSINRDHTVSNKYGFGYSIQLQHVDTQKAERITVGGKKVQSTRVKNPNTKKKDIKTKNKVKPSTNKGRKQVTKSSKATMDAANKAKIAASIMKKDRRKTQGKRGEAYEIDRG